MKETIQDNKFVELTYKVTDQKSGHVLSTVEFPLAYIHNANDLLGAAVTAELEGKSVGDVVEVPIDCDRLIGPRDESLVFTSPIEEVPEEYRELGSTIVMENEKGETRNFIVTRMDGKTLTVDANHPLCGRTVVFRLEVLTVRDPTDEELEAGGAVGVGSTINESLMIPV